MAKKKEKATAPVASEIEAELVEEVDGDEIDEVVPEDLLDDDLEDAEDLDDGEDMGDADLDTVLAGEDPEAEIVPLVAKKRAKKGKKDAADDEDEDDDDELVGEDDIEEDLGVILAARVKGRSEDDEEGGEEEEEEEIPSSTDPDTGIQPKRADERMCTQCFLLVRKSAPMCPVGDDTCPLFC